MPNYKESTGTTTSWQRAYQVNISNKLSEVPKIIFYEEEAVNLGSGNFITKHVGHLEETFTNPLTEFNLINPETGDVIGTSTYMQAYLILHSMYMHLVYIRDNPIIIVDPVVEDPPPEEPPV
jgi:hypothetical protein